MSARRSLLDQVAELTLRGVDCVLCAGVDTPVVSPPVAAVVPTTPAVVPTVVAAVTPPAVVPTVVAAVTPPAVTPPIDLTVIPFPATVKDAIAFMAEHNIAGTEPNGSVVGVGEWHHAPQPEGAVWTLPVAEVNLTHRAMLYTSRVNMAPFTNEIHVRPDRKKSLMRFAT